MKQIFRHKPPQQVVASYCILFLYIFFSIDLKFEVPKNGSNANSNITALISFCKFCCNLQYFQSNMLKTVSCL